MVDNFNCYKVFLDKVVVYKDLLIKVFKFVFINLKGIL